MSRWDDPDVTYEATAGEGGGGGVSVDTPEEADRVFGKGSELARASRLFFRGCAPRPVAIQ